VATVNIRVLRAADAGFRAAFAQLLNRGQADAREVEAQVRTILDTVCARGDAALLEYTMRFDTYRPASAAALELPCARLKSAAAAIPAEQRAALETAAERIRVYHTRQKIESWNYTEADDTLLGQQVSALERVGLYVPGGKAAYPSSVLMNAIPAKLAGVGELIMVTPTPGGEINELVLAAAHVAGVDRVFTVGGAQAIAALAYGTATVPRVDKIVGPGNIYVATAKRLVYGQVAIDMIAGPSEVVVVADATADADWVAMDLFSQAEHDERAQAILITPDEAFLGRVRASIERLLDGMERAAIIRTALEGRGALIVVPDMNAALDLANEIAPEHLELAVDNAEEWLTRVRHAGAVFVGHYSAEALGDYCAGPNHVLPTSGTARFSSPLGVYDFQKRTSVIRVSREGASALGRTASILARGEGLTAHARSAEYRIKK
jgi:histidinol dehydrogenase